MTTAVETRENVQTFTADEFVSACRAYGREPKVRRIIDAASAFDSVEDAVAALEDAVAALDDMSKRGGVYTPPKTHDWGGLSASAIADMLLGRSANKSTVRKSASAVGKS
jgi:hypothetical protein